MYFSNIQCKKIIFVNLLSSSTYEKKTKKNKPVTSKTAFVAIASSVWVRKSVNNVIRLFHRVYWANKCSQTEVMYSMKRTRTLDLTHCSNLYIQLLCYLYCCNSPTKTSIIIVTDKIVHGKILILRIVHIFNLSSSIELYTVLNVNNI